MSKSKTHGKDKKKAAQLVLRVEKAERDAFVALCERLDTTAAREIRRFMREMVASNAEAPVSEASAAEPEAETEAAPAEGAAPKRRKKAVAPVEAPPEMPPQAEASAQDSATVASKRRKTPAV